METLTLKSANDSFFKRDNKTEFCIDDKCYRYEDTVKTTKKCSEGIMSVDLIVAFNYQTYQYIILDLSKKRVANKKITVTL